MNEAKRQLVQSWLTKAQHDLASARVLAASAEPLLDTAIYHCQQAAEKAVKGFLAFRDQGPRRGSSNSSGRVSRGKVFELGRSGQASDTICENLPLPRHFHRAEQRTIQPGDDFCGGVL